MPSGNQLVDHLAAELAELLEAAGVVEGEFVVIQAQEMQQRAMDVADVVDVFDGFAADLIGVADGVTALGAAAGEPHGHGFGVVVTTVALAAAALTVVGGAAEFAAENNKGVVQHAPFFQVVDEGGNGLIDGGNQIAVRTLNVVVAVPVAGVGLHEADTLLDKAAGKETFATEGVRARVADAVGFQGFGVLTFEVENLGNLGLHAVGKFVGLHAGFEFATAGALDEMFLIQGTEEIKGLALCFAGDACRGIEVQDRTALRAQRCALKLGRQITVGPVGGTALRIAGAGQYDKARQIFILCSETVGDPGADAGIAAETIAGVDVITGRRVIDGFDLRTTEKAHVINVILQVAEFGGDVSTVLASLDELEGALDEIAFAGGHRAFHFTGALEFLQVTLSEFRLWVKSVDVRRTTFHEEKNTSLGLGRVVSLALSALQHGTEGNRTEAGAHPVEEITARRSGDQILGVHGKRFVAASVSEQIEPDGFKESVAGG